MPIAITEANFAHAVIDQSRQKPVLIYFWASWCAPCRMMGPILERMEKKNDSAWLLGKVSTEAEVELTSRCEINSLPALQLYMGGVMVAEFIDLLPETKLVEWLQSAIAAATGP